MSGPRLSITPAGAIFDRSLEPRDLHVLNLLGCYTDKAGWCRRSQVKMASQLDCSRSSVQRSLDRLVEAGWVQKKRPPWSREEGQPSNSYMYRVILDRDDFVVPELDSEPEAEPETEAESYAETALEEGHCSPVGTPLPSPGHPGAQPCVGTGAQPYVGTKNDPLERPPLERERDARARGRKEKFKAAFKSKWPDVGTDSQQRLDYALDGLTEEEEAPALAGIEPFFAALKRKGRGTTPAASTYVEEKRWAFLTQPDGTPQPASYPRGSAEAKAIEVLHEIAGRGSAFRTIFRQRDGSVSASRFPMTSQLLVLGGPEAPQASDWATLTAAGAASWERMLAQFFEGMPRQRLHEGARAPWPFAPSLAGKIYATGPPEDVLMSEQDKADLK